MWLDLKFYIIESSIVRRLRVLFGHYYCPNCYRVKCTNTCGKRHQKELSKISKVIGKKDFAEARRLIKELEVKLGEYGYDDPEIVGLNTLMVFMEGGD